LPFDKFPSPIAQLTQLLIELAILLLDDSFRLLKTTFRFFLSFSQFSQDSPNVIYGGGHGNFWGDIDMEPHGQLRTEKGNPGRSPRDPLRSAPLVSGQRCGHRPKQGNASESAVIK